MHAISRDPSLRATVAMADGRELTGLALQRIYLDRVAKLVDSRDPDPRAADIVQTWAYVLDQLERDPMDCAGYVLPESVVSPWRVAAGFAYRRADSAWNQLLGGLWRDEPALTFAGDLVFTVGFEHPDWYNGFEHDPEEAARVRVRLLRELAANRESLVATHLSFPSVCHVAVDGDVFRWVPGPWQY